MNHIVKPTSAVSALVELGDNHTMEPCGQGSPTKRPRNDNNDPRRAQFADKLLSIASEFGLNLPHLGSENSVPFLPFTLEEKCVRLVKFLFWKDQWGLETCLIKFRTLEAEKRTAASLRLLLKARKEEVTNELGSRNASARSVSDPFGSTADTSLKAPEIQDGSLNISASTSFTSKTSSLSRSFIANTSAQTSFTEYSTENDGQFLSPMTEFEEENEMPQKLGEHYNLRKFPTKGLFVKPLPAPLSRASERVRYECVRLAQKYRLDIGDIAGLYMPEWEDCEVLWKSVSQLIPPPFIPSKVSKSAWDSAGRGLATTHRTARFQYQKRSDYELFRLDLNPIEELPEGKSCRLFRHFGAHRFLKLEIPMNSRPEYLASEEANIRARTQEWCAGPAKELAGYEWKVFFVRNSKSSSKKSKRSKDERLVGYEAFLFAEKGLSLEPIAVDEMIRWFLPLEQNHGLSVHKAFARIELGLSKTYATLIFEPSQIYWVENILADGTKSDDSLLDSTVKNNGFSGSERYDQDNPNVMNDGCSRISMAAANRVWALLNQPGPCPSVFQARMGPWKGVWMVADDQGLEKNRDTWIEVTPSQQKFEPHPHDKTESYDRDRLTFEVLAWSSKAAESTLYKDFLPILEERGVPRSVLGGFVKKGLDSKKEELFTALKSNRDLFKWSQSFCPVSADIDIQTPLCGAMPPKVASRVTLLLSAGFDLGSEYLANQVKNLAVSHFKRVGVELDIPLPQSTNIFGIADPTGCLEPDEIHLAFSGQFGEERFPFLDKIYALVARQPALARSDIQKVRVVYKEQLRHLLDVVVFPTRGIVPLADKLQGGDYDGDRFWICWAPSIVEPFRNVPPRYTLARNPEFFGIDVDRTKIGEISADGYLLRDFLPRCLKAAFQAQLLGIVTIFWRKLCYVENSISTKEIADLVDLHDFLVDSSKNGYFFGFDAWRRFQRSLKGVRCQEVEAQETAYTVVTESELFDPKPCSYNPNNMIDHMIFEVAHDHTIEILEAVKSFSAVDDSNTDTMLTKLYMDEISNGDPIVKVILQNLKQELNSLYEGWKHKRDSVRNKREVSIRKRSEDLHNNSHEAHVAYEALSPREQDMLASHSLSKLWLHKSPGQPSYWEQLKASAIFARFTENWDFAFDCAGRDLCHMKAHSNGRPIVVVPQIYDGLKMGKKRKRAATETAVPKEAEQEDLDPLLGAAVAIIEKSRQHETDDVFADEDLDMVDDGRESQPFYEAFETLSQSMAWSTINSPKKGKRGPSWVQ